MDQIQILIVEDEFLIARGLSRKLIALGYKVTGIVSSGREAIEQVIENQPDLILMDIAIQGDLDGIETAEKINKLYNIPVIYVTAYADDKTIERAQVTGSYGYLLKPYKDRELHATIKIALNKHKEAQNLQQTAATAEAISQERARYLSMASHDLRTPLTTIRMSADMLQNYGDKLTEARKETHLERIQEAVTNMNDLLENILILSKSSSPNFILQFSLVNLENFCREIAEEFQPLAGSDHTINFSCPENLPLVNLDERLLRHILANLLSNALKYSPSGGIVDLNVIFQENKVIFEVKDQGIGIPPEYQSKMFQQFERADNVGDIKGTGLGLSIVKQAVNLHGGNITVESSLGIGTIFTVTLPITL